MARLLRGTPVEPCATLTQKHHAKRGPDVRIHLRPTGTILRFAAVLRLCGCLRAKIEVPLMVRAERGAVATLDPRRGVGDGAESLGNRNSCSFASTPAEIKGRK